MVSIIGEKNLIFDRFYRSIGLRFFFLMTTIDLIDVFCRHSIIGIDPIDVFLTICAQLWTADTYIHPNPRSGAVYGSQFFKAKLFKQH
jgi:hypothetical protein